MDEGKISDSKLVIKLKTKFSDINNNNIITTFWL